MQDPIFNSILLKFFFKILQKKGNLEQIENKVYKNFISIDIFLFFELIETFRQPLRLLISTKRYRKKAVKVTKIPTRSSFKHQFKSSIKLILSFFDKNKNLTLKLNSYFFKLPKLDITSINKDYRSEFTKNRYFTHFRWF